MPDIWCDCTKTTHGIEIRNRCFLQNFPSLQPRLPHSDSHRDAPAWLRQFLDEKNSKPPKLYAWTSANLPPTDGPPGGTLPPGVKAQRKPPADEAKSSRVYILGVGNIGRLYAHSLASMMRPARAPLILVVHRRDLLEHWAAHPYIELTRADGSVEHTTAFSVEWWTEARPKHGPIAEPGGGSGIANLIVATKAPDALPQVDRLRKYLGGASTVAFAQNGLCKLWPPHGRTYVKARFPGAKSPSWLACVTTHGVVSLGPFRSRHASVADVMLGPIRVSQAEPTGSDYLALLLKSAPGLEARKVGRRELWVAQLEKLVVNAVINPLTAVLRCQNGEIFADRGDKLPAVIDALLREASKTLSALIAHPSNDVILAEGAPAMIKTATDTKEGRREELLQRFSTDRLRMMLHEVGAKVLENTSSMLQDVRHGKETEIDDINGWLVDTARFLGGGLKLPAHKLLISLVKDKKALTRDELGKCFHSLLPKAA
ncbi:6-phosphogluconate dehydrogenase C-terminal domain-like protein [Whalleya microplaca]|nr:6-phosphogluconate dehydrogenase C-terminal domain-like protein [Whalleya microplaca]